MISWCSRFRYPVIVDRYQAMNTDQCGLKFPVMSLRLHRHLRYRYYDIIHCPELGRNVNVDKDKCSV